MTSPLKIIDPALALEQAGGNNELAADLLRMLLDGIGNDRAELQQALRDGDHQRLYACAHTLHGSAIYCALPALADATHCLERKIKQGQTSGLEDAVSRILHEINRILQLDPLQARPAIALDS